MVMNQLLRLSGMILQVSKWVHDNAIESLYSCMDLSESGIATNSHSHGENDENWVVPFFQTNAYTPWEFQDPKMEVLYHIKPDFWGVSPCRALRPNNMVGTSNKSVKWPLMYLLYPMFSHDFPMISHDFPMIFPWFSHDVPMISHDFPMIFPWFSHDFHDFPMIFPWFPMIFPWFPMIFLWFSRDFPVYTPQILCRFTYLGARPRRSLWWWRDVCCWRTGSCYRWPWLSHFGSAAIAMVKTRLAKALGICWCCLEKFHVFRCLFHLFHFLLGFWKSLLILRISKGLVNIMIMMIGTSWYWR